MTEIDLPRFSALCDAYGGVIARWPAAERAGAARIAGTETGARLLARADGLDGVLDSWATSRVPEDLVVAILRGAPQAPAPARRLIGLWWSGLAGLTLAGAAAGAIAVAALPSMPVGGDDGGYADTAFGGWEASG